MEKRVAGATVAFSDVIRLKYWQTLKGEASEEKRAAGEARFYPALEKFQRSHGGEDVDVAVFGEAAMGVYLTPGGIFKWTVIARTIEFDWSEAYRLAYRVDAVAERAREWWGTPQPPDGRGESGDTSFNDQADTDRSAETETMAPIGAGGPGGGRRPAWRPPWGQRRRERADERQAARRRQRRIELRRHLDRAYSLTSAIFSAVSRENALHETGETGESAKPGERYHQNLTVLIPEVEDAEARFRLAAERDAQVLYARGMVWGGLAVAVLSGIVALIFLLVAIPAQYAVAFPAGAFGGLMSVLQRMTTRSLKLDFNAGKQMLVAFGAARPMVGGVFGMALFCLLKGGLVPAVDIPAHQELAFYSAAGFLAGFNERFAQDTLATLRVA